MASYYQSIISIMKCMIKLGRVAFVIEVSIMFSHNAYPRQGNFEATFHIMYYLKIRHNLRLSLDPIYPTIDCETFKDNYWTDFYGDVKEAIYPNISNALGSSVDLCMMFDRNHAGKKPVNTSLVF